MLVCIVDWSLVRLNAEFFDRLVDDDFILIDFYLISCLLVGLLVFRLFHSTTEIDDDYEFNLTTLFLCSASLSYWRSIYSAMLRRSRAAAGWG